MVVGKQPVWCSDQLAPAITKGLQARPYNMTGLQAIDKVGTALFSDEAEMIARCLAIGLEISIVSGDLPRKERVLHPRAAADVVDDHVSLRWLVPDIRDHADVIDAAAQIPGHNVAG